MPRTAETASFKFNHTMIRIKDPKASLHFYTEVLGMDLLSEQNMGDFTLYFLGYDHDGISQLPAEEKTKARFNREGKGSASDDTTPVYAPSPSTTSRRHAHASRSSSVPFKKRLTRWTG
ncbi:hypothetical protein BU15DRAFT_44582 [Melanogaster broomeanus]|nr:hypothetical protein BU15DRAFT_44582 [Melanogaster broomeanus]